MLISDQSLIFQKALQVQMRLSQAGHLTYFAGGCVRDLILGCRPQDYDIVTSASVEQIQKLFEKTIPVGAQFGVVRLIFEGEEFEIAQFRKESDYRDGRRPTLVESATPEEDAHRRDLTINALFYDPIQKCVFDYVGGLEDLRNQKLRAVGQAEIRFREDHLRILRAVRFRAQLGFQWDPELIAAILSCTTLLTKVSRERIHDEYLKLRRGFAFHLVLKSLVDFGILKTIFPTLFFDLSQFLPLSSVLDEAVWWELALWARRSGSSHLGSINEIFSLKLSRADQKSLIQFLSWFVPDQPWLNESVGELVEKSFSIGSRDGLVLWLEQNPKKYENEKFLLESLRRHSIPPVALVEAKDLPELSGSELGLALKQLYRMQLEGLIQTKEEALSRWKSRILNQK